MRFKHFLALKEELYPEEKQKVALWQRDPNALFHTDHYFGKGNDEITEPLKDSMNKSEIHKRIERHLGQEIPIDHYKSGKTKDKYNREVKIGSLLNKQKAPLDLIHSFSNDTTRQGKKFTGLTVKTTRSAEGVAGQTSHNQPWENESCKNFNNGKMNHHLPGEVEHGTVVAYLHDHKGKEISRITMQPYIGKHGNRVYHIDSHYGINHEGFHDHVKEIAKKLSSDRVETTKYDVHPKVYLDSGDEEVFHPNLNHDQIHHIIRHGSVSDKMTISDHDNIDSSHIDKLLDDNSPLVKYNLGRNNKLQSSHIEKMLKDDNAKVRYYAIKHKNAETHHFKMALNDENETVKNTAKSRLSDTDSTYKELTT